MPEEEEEEEGVAGVAVIRCKWRIKDSEVGHIVKKDIIRSDLITYTVVTKESICLSNIKEGLSKYT